jgi:YfiH family protein
LVESIRAAALEGMPHAFTTRRGGVSQGAVASLNCGFGAADEPAAVAENRRRAAAAVLPGAPLVGVHQVHSATAVTVLEPWTDDRRTQADALVTAQSGVLLGVLAADCAPVLLADREARVIGAAHAGWRGAHAGVIEATVAAMEMLGAVPGRITSAIGPCIAQASYEVDEGFRQRFTADDERFFARGAPAHWHFDLEGYVAARLQNAGVRQVERLGLDTYGDPARFYSFRRATHRGEPDYGRQLSLIGLAPIG